MGLEFEARRRLRTSVTSPKRARDASQWEAPGDNAPDANTGCRPLARCAERLATKDAHRRAMHARGTKFAWRLGQVRAFMAGMKGLRRRFRRAAALPDRQSAG